MRGPFQSIYRLLLAPWSRQWFRVTVVSLGAGTVFGCPDKKHATTQVAGKPAMELRKAVCFALNTKGLPATRVELINSISAGVKQHVKLPDRAQPVIAEGDHYPQLSKLHVDLTDAAIDTSTKPVKLKPHETIQPGVHAESFEFRADPMIVDGGAIDLNVVARDVDFGILHDRTDHPVLSLNNARDGKVDCQTTTADLSKIFRASANERGRSVGLSVQKATISLTSDNDRDLSADVRFASRLLLVPIQLHFTAHVSVDRTGNATLTNLTCDGDDAAGTLVTQFIRPSLAQYNNKTMPLVGFPSPNLHLHDLAIHIDGENIKLTAGFGS